jgi:NitT/TauT family transport system substrate-binding protein
MHDHRTESWSRRYFLAAAGSAGLLGWRPGSLAAEPPPETTTLKLTLSRSVCTAPQFVAEEFLKLEGFTNVQYVDTGSAEQALGSAQVHISQTFAAPLIIEIDRGNPLVALTGIHVGCFELFGTDQVRGIRDLKGKMVSISAFGGPHHVFIASIVAHVGLDPRKDVTFVVHPSTEGMRLFSEGMVDAYLGFPPDPQELRAKKIGHVVVNSTLHRPWSQYFCCLLAGNREFVQKHPVATKRAVRALLKATTLCAREPERVARVMVDRTLTRDYDYALQALREIPWEKWREYNPEDTMRFYALRLHEAGMVKSSPQKIIGRGTDWRFLNELKKELKG